MIYLKSFFRINIFRRHGCIIPQVKWAISKRCYSTQLKFDVDLNIRGISLRNYIRKLEKEYLDLSRSISHKSNPRWLELSRVMQVLKKRETVVANIVGLQELLSGTDKELIELAENEKLQLELVVKQLDKKILDTLVPDEKEDLYNSVVLEVQAGVGGQEAMLFAKELFDMYCNFAEYKGTFENYFIFEFCVLLN